MCLAAKRRSPGRLPIFRKLMVPAGFPIGEILRAEVEDEVFVAVVCYSKKTREGYSIGTEMVHSIKRVHLDDLVGEWGVRA